MGRHIKPGLCFPREITATGVHVWSPELHFAPKTRVHRVRQNNRIANIYNSNPCIFLKKSNLYDFEKPYILVNKAFHENLLFAKRL